MKNNSIQGLIILGICLAACFGIYTAYNNAKAPDQIELLFTSPNQSITAMHFSGQQQSITVTNGVILEYFNRAFHNGRGNNNQGGTSYDVQFDFVSGVSAKTWIHIYDNHAGFSIAMQGRIHAGEPEYWDVRFTNPVPESVILLMNKLTLLQIKTNRVPQTTGSHLNN